MKTTVRPGMKVSRPADRANAATVGTVIDVSERDAMTLVEFPGRRTWVPTALVQMWEVLL